MVSLPVCNHNQSCELANTAQIPSFYCRWPVQISAKPGKNPFSCSSSSMYHQIAKQVRSVQETINRVRGCRWRQWRPEDGRPWWPTCSLTTRTYSVSAFLTDSHLQNSQVRCSPFLWHSRLQFVEKYLHWPFHKGWRRFNFVHEPWHVVFFRAPFLEFSGSVRACHVMLEEEMFRFETILVVVGSFVLAGTDHENVANKLQNIVSKKYFGFELPLHGSAARVLLLFDTVKCH